MNAPDLMILIIDMDRLHTKIIVSFSFFGAVYISLISVKKTDRSSRVGRGPQAGFLIYSPSIHPLDSTSLWWGVVGWARILGFQSRSTLHTRCMPSYPMHESFGCLGANEGAIKDCLTQKTAVVGSRSFVAAAKRSPFRIADRYR